jgi:acetyl esterase/lipase
MAFECLKYRIFIKKMDRKRNAQIPEPIGVVSYRNKRYARGWGKWHKLDVFRPSGVTDRLPLIVVVHGGGWIYGDKEIYHLYAKDLARRGFAVISFNYVRAPEKRFPDQLESIDKVLLWAKDHAADYAFDLHHVFLVGDSAGAQMSVQYAIAQTNPDYGKLFKMSFPLPLSGLGLNCGVYGDLGQGLKDEEVLWKYYLPKKTEGDPRRVVLKNLTSAFPPCYVLTAEKDFVKEYNKPFLAVLEEKKIPHVFKEYTSKEGNKLQHVFHVTINEEHAILANDEECDYFKKLIKSPAKPA